VGEAVKSSFSAFSTMNCNRCGQCCYVPFKGKRIRCPYLIKNKDGTTSCEIYDKRIGVVVIEISGCTWVCGYRKDRKQHIPNCPYNQLIKENQ